MKPFKTKVGNCCYIDMDKRFAIGYDRWQWILDYHGSNTYYRTLVLLFDRLLEWEVVELVGNDIYNLKNGILAAHDHLLKVAAELDIKTSQLIKG